MNLAQNIAINAGLPVAIFSLEMSKEALLQRLVSSVAGIDGQAFRRGRMDRAKQAEMQEALQRIEAAPLWIDDSGSISVLEIGAKARRLQRDKPLSLLIVDYLQLITARGRPTALIRGRPAALPRTNACPPFAAYKKV